MQPLFAATIPDASIITGLSVAFAALSGALARLYNNGRLDTKEAAATLSQERKDHLEREKEFTAALLAQTAAIEKLVDRIDGKAS